MDTDKHELQGQKTKLRAEMRGGLKYLSSEKRAADSTKIRGLLPRQPFWKTAATVLFFAPLPDEPDLWPLLEETLTAGKIVALPRFDADNQFYTPRRVSGLHAELVLGRFGIREPAAHCVAIPLDDLDLVLVPGIAFDPHGYRLGRGQGFYDRLLAGVRGIKCGMAFDEQMVQKMPAETFDVRMDFILTPTRLIKVPG